MGSIVYLTDLEALTTFHMKCLCLPCPRCRATAWMCTATLGSVIGLRDPTIGASWRQKLLWSELNATIV